MHSQQGKNANLWMNMNEESGSVAALDLVAVMGCWVPLERMARAEDDICGHSLSLDPVEHHCNWKTPNPVMASQNSLKTCSSFFVCS